MNKVPAAAWVIGVDQGDSLESFSSFLKSCIRENYSSLINTPSTRWVKVAPQWNYLPVEERPVGLSKKQIQSNLSIVLCMSKSVDLSSVTCLQKSERPGQYFMVNKKNYKISYENQPVIVQVYVAPKVKVASLKTPSNRIGQLKSTEKSSMSYNIPSKSAAINIPKGERKALSYRQQLLKIVRDNYKGFVFSRAVRSVRLAKDEKSKKTVIVMTLKNSNVDVSNVSFMKLDSKSTSDSFINEYFFVDEYGQKVQIGKRYVKIQTRVPQVMVESLKAPTNKIGQRTPSKKNSTKFFISLSSKTPVSEKRQTYRRLLQQYRSSLVNVKGVHWLRMSSRWSGLTDDESKSLTDLETKNSTAIVIGINHPSVDFSNVSCLKLDDRMSDFSNSFVNEYYLVDSKGKSVEYKGIYVKIQTRCIGDFTVASLAPPKNKIGQTGKSYKPTEFFIPINDDTDCKTEEVQTPKDRMVGIVQEYHKSLSNSPDVHWIKLGASKNSTSNNILIAVSNANSDDISKNKNLQFHQSINKNGYLNEYYLKTDGGKPVTCNGSPVKVQTLVQKVQVSALGAPSNYVRQLKKTNVVIPSTAQSTGI